MKRKEFDYYIFIDCSGKLIGYSIIENENLKKLLPKISKFAHYRNLRHKKAYLRSIRSRIEKEKILLYFVKYKIKGIRQNIDIYLDVLEFLKKHDNCIIFVSVDDNQYFKFKKIVRFVDGKRVVVKKESELKKGTAEYQASLVLDTLLNIERLKK